MALHHAFSRLLETPFTTGYCRVQPGTTTGCEDLLESPECHAISSYRKCDDVSTSDLFFALRTASLMQFILLL
eukprot:1349650-Amorphochlora_amoeboformis.AAC.1